MSNSAGMQMQKYDVAAQGLNTLDAQVAVPRVRTVRENIDAQIAMHQEAIDRLVKVKDQLGSILDIDTSTLRAAVNW